MNKRLLSVTVISWVYIAAGALGLAFHFSDFNTPRPFQYDVLGIAFVRLLAILAGAFMLRGDNWARWLALAWIAFHVIVSAFHSAFQLAMHALFCAVIAYILFRRPATEYFRMAGAAPQ